MHFASAPTPSRTEVELAAHHAVAEGEFWCTRCLKFTGDPAREFFHWGNDHTKHQHTYPKLRSTTPMPPYPDKRLVTKWVEIPKPATAKRAREASNGAACGWCAAERAADAEAELERRPLKHHRQPVSAAPASAPPPSGTSPEEELPPRGRMRRHEQASHQRREPEVAACRALDENRTFICNKLGLPCPFDDKGTVVASFEDLDALRGELPWVSSRLKLRARLVDYFSGTRLVDTAIVRWLRLLGFEVHEDQSACQIGSSCGAVAAAALAIMLRADGNWWGANCRPACGPAIVRYAYGRHAFTRTATESLRAAATRTRGAQQTAAGDAPLCRQLTYQLCDAQVCVRARACAHPSHTSSLHTHIIVWSTPVRSVSLHGGR